MRPLHQDTVKITANVLKLMAETFTKATMGAWLTRKQLGIDEPAISAIVERVLRNLLRAGMLEKGFTKGSPSHRMYRPTEAGWALLRGLDKETADALYVRFGATVPGQADGTCGRCKGRVKGRRADARVCWGCASPEARWKAGMDHMPRSKVYYDGLSNAFVIADKRRVRAARKAFAAKHPADPQRPILRKALKDAAASRPGRKLSGGRTFEQVVEQAAALVRANGGIASSRQLKKDLYVSTTVVQKVAQRLRADGVMTKVWSPTRREFVPIAAPHVAPRADVQISHVLTKLAQEIVTLRKEVSSLRAGQERQGGAIEALKAISKQQAKLRAPNGVHRTGRELGDVLKLLGGQTEA